MSGGQVCFHGHVASEPKDAAGQPSNQDSARFVEMLAPDYVPSTHYLILLG